MSDDLRRLQRIAFLAGCGLLVVCVIGGFFKPAAFFEAYLVAFLSWFALPIGSLGIWMIHELTGGLWGIAIRRVLEAAARTLPLFLAAFVPLGFGLPYVYVWAGAHSHLHTHAKEIYLDATFFLVRAGIYFASWLILAFMLGHWSMRHDEDGDPRWRIRSQKLSGPGLVILGLTVTFAGIDWLMSLTPEWYSSIFGMLIATAQLLPALALAVAAVTWLAQAPPLRDFISGDIWNDLGNLLLAFVMLWTYLSFSQFLLIWSGNLPEEIVWYLDRSQGGWQWLGAALALGYFALPFALLLLRPIKRHPERLCGVALVVVVMSFIHEFWLVMPTFSPGGFYIHWLNIGLLLSLGGLWLAYFCLELGRRPLLPRHDIAAPEVVPHAGNA